MAAAIFLALVTFILGSQCPAWAPTPFPEGSARHRARPTSMGGFRPA